MTAVIIPAYNEQAVIAGTLEHLLADLTESTRVIVVCNGCTDRTADVAGGVSEHVEVVEIDERSKTAAINTAERLAHSYPHIILDADVHLSGQSVAAMVAALSRPGALAAEPRPVFETGASSYPVRAFYRVWLALHGGRPWDVGSGAYGLSEAGRSRFDRFPEIIGDDAYVRAHFVEDEIVDVVGATSQVRAPATTRDLVRVKTRSRLGQWELARDYPELWRTKRSRTESLSAKALRLPPRAWLDVPTYLALQLWIRARAARLFRNFDAYEWERDTR